MPANADTATTKTASQIELLRDGAVATLQISNPSGVNIFNSSVVGALGQHLAQIADDARIRFVVLRSTGRVFVAGADIEQMSHFDEAAGQVFSKNGHHAFDMLEALPQPTFAAINGHAVGGGCEVALACDFRIASANAKIGLPECRLGLLPGWGGTQRLPRLIGPARAKKLMFSGEPLSADDALKIGLVDEVVPTPGDLDAALQRWFELLSPGSPMGIRRIKQALKKGDEISQFGRCFSCDEAREGMAAFLSKGQPSWKDWRK